MNDVSIGWSAEPIPPDGRKPALDNQESFAAIDAKRKRAFSGWLVAGCVTALASNLLTAAALFTIVYREKPTETKLLAFDSTTGWVGEAVGVRDAPKTFNARVASADLIKYTRARLAYLPEEDQEQFQVVRAMSNKDCFEIYNAWRSKPDSPVKWLGMTGHVLIHDFTDDPHPIHNKDDSWSYSIRFNRQEVKGVTVGITEHWQADITFAWHPEMRMSTEDEHRNYTGFQCIAFDARRMS